MNFKCVSVDALLLYFVQRDANLFCALLHLPFFRFQVVQVIRLLGKSVNVCLNLLEFTSYLSL